MLKGGSSKPPLELLTEAGVDMRQPETITTATALFARTARQIEELWAKRQPR